jgi:hypothetical protein
MFALIFIDQNNHVYLPTSTSFLINTLFYQFLFIPSSFILNSLGWYPNKHLNNKKKDVQEKEKEKENNSQDFYFIWASERTGYRQLYLYLYRSASIHGNEHTTLDNKNDNKYGSQLVNNNNDNKDNSCMNKSVSAVCAVCCNNGVPIGGGGPWIVDRYEDSRNNNVNLKF